MLNATRNYGNLTVGFIGFTRQDTTKKTFEALKTFIAAGRNKTYRKFKMQSTIAIQVNDRIDVKYHDTIILSFWEDRFRIDSGGWRTMSTKARINEFIPQPFYLGQNKSVWYLNGQPYYDGITISQDHIEENKKAKTELARVTKIKKQVKAYCEKLGKMIDERKLQDLEPRDCWLCMMRDSNDKIVLGGQDHFLSHLKEGYVHGTLVWNALEDQGCNVNFLWSNYYMRENCDTKVFKDYAVRAVRRWFYRNLGIAR
jgi:hypothetical protein